MYIEDLLLNNLKWLICHKSKPNQTKPNFCKNTLKQHIYMYIFIFFFKKKNNSQSHDQDYLNLIFYI